MEAIYIQCHKESLIESTGYNADVIPPSEGSVSVLLANVDGSICVFQKADRM